MYTNIMRKKLFEVTSLVYAHSLKGVIEKGVKFGKVTGEIIKVTLEDKPKTIEDYERNKAKMGFTNNDCN